MRNAFLLFGVCSLFCLSAVAPSMAQAEATTASAPSVEKGQMKVTIGGSSAVAKLDPHSSDWSGSGASNGTASMAALFRKGAVEAEGKSPLSVVVSLEVENQKVTGGEIVISFHDNGGTYLSREKLAKPTIATSTLNIAGDKIEATGTITAKVFLRDKGQIDESQSVEVTAEFSADLGPAQ